MQCRAPWESPLHRRITLVTVDLRGMVGHYRDDLRPHTNAQHISGAQVDYWH